MKYSQEAYSAGIKIPIYLTGIDEGKTCDSKYWLFFV
jgi:hypothetical protein